MCAQPQTPPRLRYGQRNVPTNHLLAQPLYSPTRGALPTRTPVLRRSASLKSSWPARSWATSSSTPPRPSSAATSSPTTWVRCSRIGSANLPMWHGLCSATRSSPPSPIYWCTTSAAWPRMRPPCLWISSLSRRRWPLPSLSAPIQWCAWLSCRPRCCPTPWTRWVTCCEPTDRAIQAVGTIPTSTRQLQLRTDFGNFDSDLVISPSGSTSGPLLTAVVVVPTVAQT
mmetsp:Transcript_34587/g.91925  ORF Transcript_34587/g.91925 Transcript_34587/m.91925 type:complete len:227 (+) Transcript_34587:1942-2622(+)